ncbi:MFS transporter [Pseudonocardiaceae bacterium YIM PH 21723]|nr:MFS transporter [Pseudonocardiaceae bacterium YIM PH 21723]
MVDHATDTERPSVWSIFRNREISALFAGLITAMAGAQLARAALMFLVYERNQSVWQAALIFALTLLPDIVCRPLLSGLADRYPRRTVMVTADLCRAGLVAVMAAFDHSVPTLCLLVVLVQVAAAPFDAARAATTAAIMPGPRLTLAMGAFQLTMQMAMVLGYLAGGIIVAAIQPRPALWVDAVCFLVSAAFIRFGVAARPAAAQPDHRAAKPSLLASLRDGTRLVMAEPKLRALLGFFAVTGFFLVPMGLVAPYAETIGAHDTDKGLLLAAYPAGTVLGMVIFLSRFVSPAARLRLIGPLAIVASVPLIFYVTRPDLWGSVGLLALVGAASCFSVPVSAEFMRLVPDSGRSQAYGLLITVLLGSQGLAVLAAGVAAVWVHPATVIAVSGLLGVGCAAAAARAWYRACATAPLG